MKVLWITNILLPPVCEALSLPEFPYGGWMFSALSGLRRISPSLQMGVATIWSGGELRRLEIDGVSYWLLPIGKKSQEKYNQNLETFWKDIKTEFQPDVVHIHGTELPHGLAYVRACGNEGVVASIQGILSGCARYYRAGLTLNESRKYLSFRDFIKKESIAQRQRSFEKRSRLETELFRSLDHVIGRTEWDHAHLMSLNPEAQYHYCSETLRGEFYGKKWSYENCEPHTIFASQAAYPLKGLHILLRAMPTILSRFPDTKIYVAGYDIVNLPWYRITSYGRYLRSLIRELGLEGRVEFTGPLNAAGMCSRYLKSNLFVSPSAIENSPNSLGEAMVLGMPYLSSYVGGVPDMLRDKPDAMYQFEDHEVLAKKVIERFEAGASAATASDVTRFDADLNTQTLLSIYAAISGKS